LGSSSGWNRGGHSARGGEAGTTKGAEDATCTAEFGTMKDAKGAMELSRRGESVDSDP